MSHREPNKEGDEEDCLRKLLRDYYKGLEVELPEDFILREFAFQKFKTKTFVRHLTFQSLAQVKEYLIKETPYNAYYSIALYRDPAAERMEDKSLIYAELFFDIDSDHLPGCKPVTYTLLEGLELDYVSPECVEAGKHEQLKLLDVLKEYFGFSKDEIRMYFTGNRGFHTIVKPKDEDWLKLNSTQRRELVNFLKLFEAEKLIDRKKGRSTVRVTALRRRIVETFEKSRVGSGDEREFIQLCKVYVDELVTPDVTKLARIPKTINGKSGLPSITFSSEAELHKFKFNQSLSPFKGEFVVKSLYTSREAIKVFDTEVYLLRNQKLLMPAPVAVYLALNNVVELIC
ncbi:MAG: hypothetical protein B7O98_06085 [Zestosphaera tikiterensis]|uniref:DNA primase small subunit PriS n=1 Tax=Zestosphaera tikiterensis TaxID=1973259 RepID=A0A2R7Y3V3_9CREN|nr:MAG: hypothetical protein B7O98_06085 [Zestosphaera tikiterensis]